MVMVGVVRPLAAVSVVCAADTVMAVGLITWLERVAMVPKVVMGVAREALVLWPPAPARLVETVPVTVPRVVTPKGGERQNEDEACCCCLLSSSFSHWMALGGTRKSRVPPIGTEGSRVSTCPLPQPSYGRQTQKECGKRPHTCGALHNQRGDGWFDSRDSDGGDQADAPHGHGAEDRAWLSRGPLQHHLGHSLLSVASGNFGNSSDDFCRCSSS